MPYFIDLCFDFTQIGKFEVEIMRRVSKEEVFGGSLYLLPSAAQSVALKPVARTIKRLPLHGFKSVGSHQPRSVLFSTPVFFFLFFFFMSFALNQSLQFMHVYIFPLDICQCL